MNIYIYVVHIFINRFIIGAIKFSEEVNCIYSYYLINLKMYIQITFVQYFRITFVL